MIEKSDRQTSSNSEEIAAGIEKIIRKDSNDLFYHLKPNIVPRFVELTKSKMPVTLVSKISG